MRIISCLLASSSYPPHKCSRMNEVSAQNIFLCGSPSKLWMISPSSSFKISFSIFSTIVGDDSVYHHLNKVLVKHWTIDLQASISFFPLRHMSLYSVNIRSIICRIWATLRLSIFHSLCDSGWKLCVSGSFPFPLRSGARYLVYWL